MVDLAPSLSTATRDILRGVVPAFWARAFWARTLLIAFALLLPVSAPVAQAQTSGDKETWAFEQSDVSLDPDYLFGRLDNGMRYIVRRNNRPQGTALVRMVIGSGSLSENEDERGLAHFLEHMAFNGSRAIPEGEMIRLLEREGLAFGADTNASTGFEHTLYKLDLPRAEPKLLDTAMMLMRETASELTLAPDAIERERGVVLSELRDRNTYGLQEFRERIAFATPGALHTRRLPIGLAKVVQHASAKQFRAYYAREYVPANTVMIIIGDFAPQTMVSAIKQHFSSWRAAPRPAKPVIGPIDLDRTGKTDIYLHPAQDERITVFRHRAYDKRPDSIAMRRANLLRSFGYRAINRRLSHLAARKDAPFLSAGFGTSAVFKAARTTSLVVHVPDGEWQKGLNAAASTVRTALAHGFSDREIKQQVLRTRNALENAVAAADTRSNAGFVSDAIMLIEDGIVPSTPQDSLKRFEAFVDTVTPGAVLAALRADAAPLDDPLIRFRGRSAPDGGGDALRMAWGAIESEPAAVYKADSTATFAYTDFGPAGQIVSDSRDAELGIRKVQFANGVRLNLKRTDLQRGRIAFRLNLDGGQLLDTREEPARTAMTGFLDDGGLEAHSRDELVSIFAGRNVGFSLSAGPDTFQTGGVTTPRDLLLQLQFLTASLTYPGYRSEGETRYRRAVANYYKVLDATYASAYQHAIGAIVSDDDPRFSLLPEKVAQAQRYRDLRAGIGDRLAHGAIEIALVGDVDEDAAIALVAQTLGALPRREASFQPRPKARQRRFTADRSPRLITHSGEADQAFLQRMWPTTDDSDLKTYLTLEMLERVARLLLTDELRERTGQTYSPSATSSPSGTYPGYGTFTLSAGLDINSIETARHSIAQTVAGLREMPIDADLLQRARHPLLEAYDRALKTNYGWLALADRAQDKPEDITRYTRSKQVLEAITPADIQHMAQRYLGPENGMEVLVVPKVEPATP